MRNMTLTLALNLPAKTEENAKILTTIYPPPPPKKNWSAKAHTKQCISTCCSCANTI